MRRKQSIRIVSPYLYPGIIQNEDGITPMAILKAVCRVTGVGVGAMCSDTSKQQIVQARQLFFFLMLREFTGENKVKLQDIGSIVGIIGHSTVKYGARVIQDRLDIGDKITTELVEAVSLHLKNVQNISRNDENAAS